MAIAQLLPACLLAVAQFYGHAPLILDAIVAVETGRSATEAQMPGVGIVTPNTDQTYDHGPGGINDRWIPEIASKTARSTGEVEARLNDDYCYNIGIVGYILRLRIDEAGGDFWAGVGRYHSKTPALAEAYRVRVVRKAIALYGACVFTAAAATEPRCDQSARPARR